MDYFLIKSLEYVRIDYDTKSYVILPFVFPRTLPPLLLK